MSDTSLPAPRRLQFSFRNVATNTVSLLSGTTAHKTYDAHRKSLDATLPGPASRARHIFPLSIRPSITAVSIRNGTKLRANRRSLAQPNGAVTPHGIRTGFNNGGRRLELGCYKAVGKDERTKSSAVN
jgi:hypothetical protein